MQSINQSHKNGLEYNKKMLSNICYHCFPDLLIILLNYLHVIYTKDLIHQQTKGSVVESMHERPRS